MTLDLAKKTLSCGALTIEVALPEGNRKSLLEGAWDATGMLLEGAGAVKKTAESLPYVKGFDEA